MKTKKAEKKVKHTNGDQENKINLLHLGTVISKFLSLLNPDDIENFGVKSVQIAENIFYPKLKISRGLGWLTPSVRHNFHSIISQIIKQMPEKNFLQSLNPLLTKKYALNLAGITFDWTENDWKKYMKKKPYQKLEHLWENSLGYFQAILAFEVMAILYRYQLQQETR